MPPRSSARATAEHARPDELAEAFGLVFLHVPAKERRGRIDHALALVRRGELDASGVFVVRAAAGVSAAMICLLVAGASGLLWPPQVRAGETESAALQDLLLRTGVDWLRSRGAKLVQSLLAADETALAEPLLRGGFRHITGLWYMRHPLRADVAGQRPDLLLRDFTQVDSASFQATLLRTYDDTLDCPEVNGVRQIDEILDGHRSQGQHDPHLWWLAFEGEAPVGVLLLAPVPDNASIDLSYLGIVPEARGRGIGRELTAQAIRRARVAGAVQLTLAVDIRNRPAWNLYRSLCFEPFEQREVYLWTQPRT